MSIPGKDWDDQRAGEFINAVADRFLDARAAMEYIEPGSQADVDDSRAAGHSECVSRVSYQSLVASAAGVLAVRGILTNSTGYASASFGPPLRATLLPAMRALSVLCPDDRDTRVKNALRSAAMEAEDHARSLGNLRSLDAVFGSESGRAWFPDEDMDLVEAERKRLCGLVGGAPPKESRVLGEAAAMVGDLFGEAGTDGAFVRDAVRRMWTVYSADAHGWSWQYRFRDREVQVDDMGAGRGVIRREVNVGLVLADSVLCVSMASAALNFWEMRSRHSDAEVAAGRHRRPL
ncbi:hypothetical protein [Kocuria sp. KH4]